LYHAVSKNLLYYILGGEYAAFTIEGDQCYLHGRSLLIGSTIFYPFSSPNNFLSYLSTLLQVFSSYTQHRSYLVDETLQLVRKLQFSKNAIRTYHLADEEQKQIQMITALLIHLVQFSANVPDSLKGPVNWSTIIDASVDASYPISCHEAATEACCLFWTNVLQRFTAAKTQDMSEAKGIIENLVQDLLTVLNLPEYPAAAPILEVNITQQCYTAPAKIEIVHELLLAYFCNIC
jgi:hypothetical protein